MEITLIRFASLISILAVLLLVSTTNTSSATSVIQNLLETWEGFDLYENPSKGIQIRYLANWTVDDSTDTNDPAFMVLFQAPNKSADIIVYAANMDDTRLGLQEILDFTIESYRNSSKDFSLIRSSASADLSGYPAYELVYNDRSVIDNSLLKIMERGTKIGNKLYTIIYEANASVFPSHVYAFEEMLDSFEPAPLSSLIR